MPRHLDLGNDGDVTCRGVRDDLSHLLLGVEPAVRLPVTDVGSEVLAEDGLLPPGPDLREARILLDLQPPTLIIGQMQVKRVELVEREEVDRPFR